MSLISQLLPLSNVVIDLDASSKKRVFEQAGLLFENNQGIARSTVFDSLFTRERSARPDWVRASPSRTAASKGLKDAAGAFLRLATPVQFDAPRRPSGGHVVSCCSCPNRPTKPICSCCPNSRRCSATASSAETLHGATDAAQIHSLFVNWGADGQTSLTRLYEAHRESLSLVHVSGPIGAVRRSPKSASGRPTSSATST